MIAQRPTHVASALRAVAEALPFPPAAFDAAMATLTVHHWANRHAGIAEMRRVARRRVILTFDPDVHNRMWLMDYIPEIIELESARAPSIDEVVDGIHGHTVTVLSVPHDCSDAMTIANWRHPEAYFDSMVRAGSSSLKAGDRRRRGRFESSATTRLKSLFAAADPDRPAIDALRVKVDLSHSAA